jgi:uncharacterized protein (DUF1330 family)
MSAYCIFDIKAIHDPEAMERYRTAVAETVEAHGGHYLSIGGPWQVMEGDWHPSFPVIIEFPSMDHANDWYRSEDYAEWLALRTQATDTDAVFVSALASP